MIFFECVGGDSPATVPLFLAMPPGSTTVILSNLTHTPILIDTGHMLFTGKSISTFLLFQWLNSISAETKQAAYETVARDLGTNQGKIFGSKFTKELPLTSWNEALETYKEIASKEGGKILINCQQL